MGLTLDLYHLDSAYVAWRAGLNGSATFDLYARSHPFGGEFLLIAGVQPAIQFGRTFSFDEQDIAFIRSVRPYEEAFLQDLQRHRFTGAIDAIREGTLAFAEEPLLRVSGPFRETLLLESGLLRQMNLSTLIATKAARVVLAADGRPVAEFGLRRSHDPYAAARAAFIGGCSSTSFVDAGRRYGIPTSGTVPHALVQAFGSEADAFAAIAESLERYALLLDTYNVRRAIQTAVEVARDARQKWGHELTAVRLDSGDIASDARYVRTVLDAAGLGDVRIFASGDLDEFGIEDLLRRGAPVDAFGVGTSIGTGAGSVEHGVPGGALTVVYKLVWYDGPVLKQAERKDTWPGRKRLWRIGRFDHDLIALEDEPQPEDGTPLLEPFVRNGEPVRDSEALEEMRTHAALQLDTLPERHKKPTGAQPYEVRRSVALERMRHEAAAGHEARRPDSSG